jgi:c-di-GMP-binding flagellar brake protein YcgR
MTRERRSYPRFTVDIMDIHGKMLFANDVTILDISMGGVLLKADRRLNIGRDYTMRLESKGKFLNVQGTVVRSMLSESRKDEQGEIVPIYTAGMHFINLSNEKMSEVKHFIREHMMDEKDMERFDENMFQMSGLRLYVRFNVEEPERAVLHIQDSYTVKRISLSGMLIESENCLEIEDNVPMEMTLPDNNVVMFLGRVVRCQLKSKEDGELYRVGIEFIEMSERDNKLLSDFIISLD